MPSASTLTSAIHFASHQLLHQEVNSGVLRTTPNVWDIQLLSRSLSSSAVYRLVSYFFQSFDASTTSPPKGSKSKTANEAQKDPIKILSDFPIAETFVIHALVASWLSYNIKTVKLTTSTEGSATPIPLPNATSQGTGSPPVSGLYISQLIEIGANSKKDDTEDARNSSQPPNAALLVGAMLRLRAVGNLWNIVSSLSRLSQHLHRSNSPSSTLPNTVYTFPSSIPKDKLSTREWHTLFHFGAQLAPDSKLSQLLPPQLLPVAVWAAGAIEQILANHFGSTSSKASTGLLGEMTKTKLEAKLHAKKLRPTAHTAPKVSSPNLGATFSTSSSTCAYCNCMTEETIPSGSAPQMSLSSSPQFSHLSPPCPSVPLPLDYCAASGLLIRKVASDGIRCERCQTLVMREDRGLPAWVSAACPFCGV